MLSGAGSWSQWTFNPVSRIYRVYQESFELEVLFVHRESDESDKFISLPFVSLFVTFRHLGPAKLCIAPLSLFLKLGVGFSSIFRLTVCPVHWPLWNFVFVFISHFITHSLVEMVNKFVCAYERINWGLVWTRSAVKRTPPKSTIWLVVNSCTLITQHWFSTLFDLYAVGFVISSSLFSWRIGVGLFLLAVLKSGSPSAERHILEVWGAYSLLNLAVTLALGPMNLSPCWKCTILVRSIFHLAKYVSLPTFLTHSPILWLDVSWQKPSTIRLGGNFLDFWVPPICDSFVETVSLALFDDMKAFQVLALLHLCVFTGVISSLNDKTQLGVGSYAESVSYRTNVLLQPYVFFRLSYRSFDIC